MKQLLERWAAIILFIALAGCVALYAKTLVGHNDRINRLEIEVQLLRDRCERNDITLISHYRRLRDLER